MNVKSDNGLSVGVLVPANNTTVEIELPLWLPAGSSITILRIPRGKGLLTEDTLPEYRRAALDLAAGLAGRELDTIAYACTAASFLLGPAGDEDLRKDLMGVTGKPVVTIADAMVHCLLERGAMRPAVVTPYSDVVNHRLASFLAAFDIRVEQMSSFKAEDVEQLSKITAPDVADLARSTVTDEADGMFIACAQLPTWAVLADLQNELNRPVLSSINALAIALTELGYRR